MALYFPNSDSLLLLIPKTGSTWVREATQKAGVYAVPVGPEILRGHGYLSLSGRGFRHIGAFVRHPVSWHASYWAYRNSARSSWDMRWKIDRLCQSDNFAEYVDRVTSSFPSFVGNLFSRFTGPENDPISFIGKQETLRSDLVRFLNICEEEYDAEVVEKLAPLNVDTRLPEISDALAHRILSSEQEALHRYGYSPRWACSI